MDYDLTLSFLLPELYTEPERAPTQGRATSYLTAISRVTKESPTSGCTPRADPAADCQLPPCAAAAHQQHSGVNITSPVLVTTRGTRSTQHTDRLATGTQIALNTGCEPWQTKVLTHLRT